MDTQTNYRLQVPESMAGERLDKFLVIAVPKMSRSRLQQLIDGGYVTSGEEVISDAARKIKAGQRFEVIVPKATPSQLVAQKIALDIVFEDAHMLVINKPAGLTVHPAPGHPDMTLVNALLAHCGKSLSGIGGVARPGIVHRLDKDTSGLMVVAKNDTAHQFLSEQLSSRTLKRTYNAIVWGTPPKTGTIEGNIDRHPKNRQKMAVVKTGGRDAVTHYKVMRNEELVMSKNKNLTPHASPLTPQHSPLFSLVECKLETGRTHQIRVHMTHIGHPLVGDPVYGPTTQSQLQKNLYKSLAENTKNALLTFKRQALHAKEIGFIHPHSKKEMHFVCELPEDMLQLLKFL